MNKETIETAANKYSPDPLYTDGQWEFGDVIDGFKTGAEWQEQQSANEAVEFADWLFYNTYEARWKNEEKRYLNKDAKPYSSQQLYELWLQTKNTIV